MDVTDPLTVLLLAPPVLGVWARAAGGPRRLWRAWVPASAAALWGYQLWAQAQPSAWEFTSAWWPAVPVLATALLVQLLAVARVRPALIAPPAVVAFAGLAGAGLTHWIA